MNKNVYKEFKQKAADADKYLNDMLQAYSKAVEDANAELQDIDAKEIENEEEISAAVNAGDQEKFMRCTSRKDYYKRRRAYLNDVAKKKPQDEIKAKAIAIRNDIKALDAAIMSDLEERINQIIDETADAFDARKQLARTYIDLAKEIDDKSELKLTIISNLYPSGAIEAAAGRVGMKRKL
jgi:hypothetical protein